MRYKVVDSGRATGRVEGAGASLPTFVQAHLSNLVQTVDMMSMEG